MNELVNPLNHQDSKVRKDAVKKLCTIGGSSVIEPLLTALQDEDENIGNIAACYFQKAPDIRILEPVIKIIRDGQDPLVTLPLINALGKLGEPAVMPLVSIFEDNISLSAFEEECIIKVLGNLNDPRAIGVLRKKARKADYDETRELASEAIKKIRRWWQFWK